MYNNNFLSNQQMMNQLYRQRDNIENLIAQYSNQTQPPVQNIINTNATTNVELEARILKNGEDISNIAVVNKTLFIDEKNKKIVLKDTDGTITPKYDIIIPMDEKDKKILELQKKIKELEVKFDEHNEFNKTNENEQRPVTDGNELAKSTTKTNSKSTSTKIK